MSQVDFTSLRKLKRGPHLALFLAALCVGEFVLGAILFAGGGYAAHMWPSVWGFGAVLAIAGGFLIYGAMFTVAIGTVMVIYVEVITRVLPRAKPTIDFHEQP
jgi:hypothetical protein